jgi:streptogramin lyase
MHYGIRGAFTTKEAPASHPASGPGGRGRVLHSPMPGSCCRDKARRYHHLQPRRFPARAYHRRTGREPLVRQYNASSDIADVGKITTTGTATTYSIPGSTGYGPGGITSGPYGEIWFTEVGSGGYIGKITPGGTVTVVAPVAWPREIAPGPGGNLWFTTGVPGEGLQGKIGRITPAGQITMFNNPAIHSPQGITEGPDGNMWFVNPTPGTVGRITPCGKVTIFTGPGIYQPYDITTGPDGALWFTNPGNGSIGRITTTGVVSNFAGHGIARPFGIATGPDGALWFTGASRIGRITAGGAISIYDTQSSAYPLGGSAGMARGSDGAMWFANSTEDSIGRITTSVTPEITGFAPHAGGRERG